MSNTMQDKTEQWLSKIAADLADIKKSLETIQSVFKKTREGNEGWAAERKATSKKKK